ncbi:MAG TPA: SAM-dependent methyltransferase [Sphingomonas sp.]|nr:SAM-dependent methyltransferase [Sphingomonas sp.]
MSGIGDPLRARIAAGGPIAVDEYIETANAHYYATRDPLGLAGDFITAPEISQMFGEIVGAALCDVWVRAGRPPDAVYAELGPGRGTLAEDALKVMRRAGFTGSVHFIETSDTLRATQAKRVPDAKSHCSTATLPKVPILLVANEFFDALPIRQWIGSAARCVTHDGARFQFTHNGPIREDSPARQATTLALAHHLAEHGGAALIIDYGYCGGEHGDTLQAVRAHGFADPLERPGEQDLTAHVDFQALASAARSEGVRVSSAVTQGGWLETLGIGARAATLAARNPDQTEAIATARRRLSDEDEMGRLFKVIGLTAVNWPRIAGLE